MQPRPSDFRFYSADAVEQFTRILKYALEKNGRRVGFLSTSGQPKALDGFEGSTREGHMKGMATAPDYYIPPPKGPHDAVIIAAEPCLSKKNNTQIKISIQIVSNGEVLEDYIGTDGTVKGAGLSKNKLRGLGIDVSTDVEIADEVIASQLLNRRTIVELDHEPQQKKDEATGGYTNAFHFDSATGQNIPLFRARVVGFRSANVGAPAPAPQQQYAAPAAQQYAPPVPQMYSQPPAQFAQPAAQPPFVAQPQAPTQYAPPVQQQQPVYAQPAQQAPVAQPQYAQQPQYQQPAPQQPMPQAWAPAPGAPQVQYAQAPQAQQQQAQPVYQQPPQIPQMAPIAMQPPAPPAGVPWATAPAPQETPAQTEEKKKRGRPPKAQAEAQAAQPQQPQQGQAPQYAQPALPFPPQPQ